MLLLIVCAGPSKDEPETTAETSVADCVVDGVHGTLVTDAGALAAAAAAGGVVCVAAGTYAVNLGLEADAVLDGEGGEGDVVLDGAGLGDVVHWTGYGSLALPAGLREEARRGGLHLPARRADRADRALRAVLAHGLERVEVLPARAAMVGVDGHGQKGKDAAGFVHSCSAGGGGAIPLAAMMRSLNVLGTPLRPCSHDPLTGWFRDGCCNTDANDQGLHTVCARVTQPFLEFLARAGNNLIDPVPEVGFPGLQPGDQWCVVAYSWYQAYQAGKACPVALESTHQSTLRAVPLEALMAHAIADEA